MQTTKDYISDDDFVLVADMMECLSERGFHIASCMDMIRVLDTMPGEFSAEDVPFGDYGKFKTCVLNGWFSNICLQQANMRYEERLQKEMDKKWAEMPDLPSWEEYGKDNFFVNMGPDEHGKFESRRETYERIRNRIHQAKSRCKNE